MVRLSFSKLLHAPVWSKVVVLGLGWGIAACGVVSDEEDAMARDVAAAQACVPGQPGLVITELMANPIGPDRGREWLEVMNVSAEPLCLGGATLHMGLPWAPKSRVLRNLGCMPPHSLWLLADGTDAWGTAAQKAQYHYGQLAMPNGQGTVAISCGGQVMDAVEYGTGTVPTPQAGRALARNPMVPGGAFCLVSGEADARGDVGSPGQPNPGCATCRDGAGRLREARQPSPRELTDVSWRPLARSGPVGDRREWGTLWMRGPDRAVDLSGLRLGMQGRGRQGRQFALPEGPCMTLQPRQEVLLPVIRPQAQPGAHQPWAFVGPRSPGRGYLDVVLRPAVADAEADTRDCVPAPAADGAP